jgi:hypothetical protein
LNRVRTWGLFLAFWLILHTGWVLCGKRHLIDSSLWCGSRCLWHSGGATKWEFHQLFFWGPLSSFESWIEPRHIRLDGRKRVLFAGFDGCRRTRGRTASWITFCPRNSCFTLRQTNHLDSYLAFISAKGTYRWP